MKVNKKELAFLKQYTAVTETSTALGDKLKISVKPGKVTYAQSSGDTTLITPIGSNTAEEFDLLVNTKMFYDFISTINDTDEIIITEKGISLGEDKSYTFESYDLNFPNIEKLLEDLEKEDQSQNPDLIFVDFVDFDELAILQKFIGDDSTETLGIMKTRLLATNRIRIAYCDSSINIPDNKFISKKAVQLLLSQKDKKTVRIGFSPKFYFFKVDDTICIFDWRRYSVPAGLFEPDMYKHFNHVDYIKVNRTELITALTRMSFFTSDNPGNRIFLTITGTSLSIENRDFNKSYEKIPVVEISNNEIENTTFIFSNKHIIEYVKCLGGDDIYLYVNPDPNLQKVVRFEDGVHKYHFALTKSKEE